ncbi:hypothetical protein L2U69_11835 [Zavarzinia compransoris]|uniref:hypothetical protein n=1 Tax=Zavarzinia marina TaxID=2911065 RepID=UPI001F4067C4|nr:hypothetical protein [Zavarzinia marina]MCF4166337.1 hypothetical protein [Zavarzinia marina]
MADAVTTQIIQDGPRHAVVKLTNLSDGTGEAAVTKVDVSALSGAPSEVHLARVFYCVQGMVATLLWDATADVRLMDLAGDGEAGFETFGGISNNAGAGKTGDILLTTTGASAGDSYTIVLWLTKHYG